MNRLVRVTALWAACLVAGCTAQTSGQTASAGPRSQGYVGLAAEGDQFTVAQPTYAARIQADGSFLVAPRAQPDAVATNSARLETVAITRGDATVDLGAAGALSDGSGGAAVARGPVLERFQAAAEGLFHTWTFPAEPDGTGDAVVRVRVSGAQVSTTSSTTTVLHVPGASADLRIGKALWIDAAGAATAVAQEVISGDLVYRIPAALLHASRYPAVLDPLVGSATAPAVSAPASSSASTYALTVGAYGPGSVSSGDGAISCGATCSATYDAGSSVVLTATPAPGALFIGWSGLCFGTNTCTVPMSMARFVYAYFEPGTWPVTVVKVGGGQGVVMGSGIDCPVGIGICTVQVANTRPRASVSFSATPDGSSLFRGWSSECDKDPCTFQVDRPKSAYATFVASSFPLTVAAAGGGTGTISGGGIQCASGSTSGCSTTVANTTPATQVTLTAAPTGSSIFGGWSWPCSGLSPTCTLTLDAAKSVTASFLSGSFPLSVSVSGAGRVTGGGIDCTSFGTSGCTVTVANQVPAPEVTLTATADPGAVFAGWSGPCVRNGSQCTVIVDRASGISAIFQSSKVQLAVVTTGHGAGTVTGAGINCTSGSTSGCSTLVDLMNPPQQVTLHAAPDASSLFSGWSGPCGGTGDCTLAMDAAKTAVATFAPRNLTVKVSLAGGTGTVTGPNGFSCSSSTGCSFTVPNSSPAQQIVLTAAPSASFVVWGGDCSGTSATCNLTVNDHKNVYANFQGTTSGGPPSASASRIVAGGNSSAFLTADGSLWGWGANGAGQLGDGTTIDRYVAVPGPSGFATVRFGYRHAVGLKADGSLWTWGFNARGQLGDGTTSSRSSPVPIGTGFKAVAAGQDHTAAVKSDGTLWAWGGNDHGQLGDGTTVPHLVPEQIGSGFDTVAAGPLFTLALKQDGSLWAWGANNNGQLGDGTTSQRNAPVQVGSGFTSISAGASHSVAVDTNGTLWAWGYNVFGQLGDGTTTGRTSPVPVGTGYSSVVAGYNHTVALSADGTLWAWGYNVFGQLGDGTTTNRTSPVPVGSGFVAVAAGAYHNLGLRADGTVWSWGADEFGQLGIGRTVGQLQPGAIGVSSTAAPVATSLVFTSEAPPAVVSGQVITPALRVAVLDQYGAPYTSGTFPVTISPTRTTNATLSGTTTVATVLGEATFADLSLLTNPSLELLATSPGLDPATTAIFAVQP